LSAPRVPAATFAAVTTPFGSFAAVTSTVDDVARVHAVTIGGDVRAPMMVPSHICAPVIRGIPDRCARRYLSLNRAIADGIAGHGTSGEHTRRNATVRHSGATSATARMEGGE
jgi:hypothetical protein